MQRWNGYWQWLTLLPAVVAGVGCQAPGQPEQPTMQRVQVENEGEFDRLWRASEETLIKHFHEIDRRDRLAGVMTTLPETSAVWFELWRPQPQPAYYWWESNLHTVRRMAEVQFEKVDEDAYEVAVRVERLRYSLPERQIDNAAAAMRLYSSDTPMVAGGEFTEVGKVDYWIPEGRDAYAERSLLDAIVGKYGLAEVVGEGMGIDERMTNVE